MTDTDQTPDTLDELGPVDWIVVEFPGSKFNGTIAPHLTALVEKGLVNVLDLVFITKHPDGTLDVDEIEDLDASELGELRSLESRLATLLSADDVTAVAEAIEPGSSAALLVWENLWAAPFGAAVRHAGGQLVASGRIPVQGLLAALEAESAQEADADANAESATRSDTDTL